MQGVANMRGYEWRDGFATHELQFVPVAGTAGSPFLFGVEPHRRPIEIRDFHIATTPVTQALWTHVMGSNPSVRPDPRCPVENVSWEQITGRGGFLERINASPVLRSVAGSESDLRFRLPSETEWEYAARGGPHWTDGFAFAGSNDPDAVAWYGRRFSGARRLTTRVLGWRVAWPIVGRGNTHRSTRTHDVATKEPNQLGIYDMCGNVWEWCQDACVDLDQVPPDGSPAGGPGTDRRLRGGCHHNWDIHCTVWWRYGLAQDFHDGCVGFRLVLAAH